MLTLNDSVFSTVIAANMPTFVFFSMVGCSPCSKLKATAKKLAPEVLGYVNFATCDVDSCPEATIKYGIEVVPTLIVFKNSAEMVRHAGLINPLELQTLVKNYS